jgi:hypothetical protein
MWQQKKKSSEAISNPPPLPTKPQLSYPSPHHHCKFGMYLIVSHVVQTLLLTLGSSNTNYIIISRNVEIFTPPKKKKKSTKKFFLKENIEF